MTSDKLSLGCGDSKPGEEWVGLDRVDTLDVDVVHDLETGALPFDDGSFEVVEARHVLEHLPHEEYLEILEEVRRVLQPDGLLYVVGPHFLSWNSCTEDHYRSFGRRSFDIFDPRHDYPNQYPDLFHVENWLYDFLDNEHVNNCRKSFPDDEVAAHVPNAVNEIIFELSPVKHQ